MKRIKYLFIIALFIPLFQTSQSFAIDEQQIRNVLSLEYRLNGSTDKSVNIGNSQTLIYSPDVISSGRVTLNRFKLNFNNNIDTGNGRFFRHIFQITIVRNRDADSPVVNCPQSDWERRDYIRNCQLLSHTSSDSATGIYGRGSAVGTSSLLDVSGSVTDTYIMQIDIGNRQTLSSNYRIFNGVIVTAPQASLVYYAPLQTMGYLDESSPETEAIQEQTDKVQEQIDKDNQDRADMQSQQSDSESSADDTAEAITSASDSLLAVISNFVNIIIHPPQRDCTINGNMGHMDLGSIDLCQLSPPPAISTVATLLIIGFVIPFAYGIISTILNLLKGATQ